MDKFTKVIPITFDVKDASLREAERKVDNFAKNFQDGMSFDKLKKELETAFESKAMIAQVDELISELEGLHGAEIDAFRSSLEAYREQLNPVKSMNQLLESQYDLHRQIKELEKSGGNNENLETLRQMRSELESQIALMGTDGQLAILQERQNIEAEILALSALDTKEAKEKIKALEEQAKWLGKTYDISKDEHDEKKSIATDAVKTGIEGFGRNFSFIDGLSDMTSSFSGILSGFQKGFIGGLVATGAAFIAAFAKTLKEGQEAAEELLSASRFSNSDTRTTMLEWGTTEAGAYGVNQAMDIMGYNSQEDFMNETNEKSREKFFQLQTQFAQKYIQMQETGLFDELLQAQIEMTSFEKELEMQQAEFYMENLESIKAIKEVSLWFQSVFVKFFGALIKQFKFDPVKPVSTINPDVIQASTHNSTYRTTSVSIDNSFNTHGVSTQSSVESSLQQLFNVVDAAIS